MTKQSSRKSKKAKASKASRGNGTSPEPRSARSVKEPTVQDRKYVAGRIAGKTKKQAALDAGYALSTAENTKQKLDKKPAVQRLFKETLDAAGITDDAMARRLKESLDAMETKFWAKDGKVEEERNVVAHDVRLKAIELAAKLKGLLVDRFQADVGPTLGEILAKSYERH